MSTTDNNGDNISENDINTLESENNIEETFDSLESLGTVYENVLIVSEGSEIQNEELYEDQISSVDSSLKPSRTAYREQKDSISEINGLEEDTVIIGLDLDMDLPYLHERSSEKYSFEGNWWDNVDQLDADVLLDRTSYEGAVSIPYDTEIEKLALDDFQEEMYLLTQNNP